MTKNLVIAVLLIVVALFLFSDPSYNGGSVTIVRDTVYQQKTFTKYKKGNDIQSYIIKTDSVYIPIHDTVQVLTDYMRKYAYSDTIHLDTNNVVFIQDTITQNKIVGRSVGLNIQEKTIYITKTITPKDKTAVYFGFLTDLRQENKQLGVGVGLAIKTPKKGVITLNATTNNYSLGYYLKF
jgi:hypothetical protein